MRVYSDGSARREDDGYRCALVPGLHNSGDALRLAEEVAFASGRLLALGASPPGLYAEVREQGSWERATWMCFLIAYLSPLQEGDPGAVGGDPFTGIRRVLSAWGEEEVPSWRDGKLADLHEVSLGPRTSHDAARGAETLRAYLQWAERAGSQVRAYSGDLTWSEERRFERLFERLMLPGLGRMGRYDLLVTVGRLGLYELRADALHFARGRMDATGDLTTLAAKRLFGIGDPLILERRAHALAEAMSTPVDALDLALANWGTAERATMGFPPDTCDGQGLERAREALELQEQFAAGS